MTSHVVYSVMRRVKRGCRKLGRNFCCINYQLLRNRVNLDRIYLHHPDFNNAQNQVRAASDCATFVSKLKNNNSPVSRSLEVPRYFITPTPPYMKTPDPPWLVVAGPMSVSRCPPIIPTQLSHSRPPRWAADLNPVREKCGTLA